MNNDFLPRRPRSRPTPAPLASEVKPSQPETIFKPPEVVAAEDEKTGPSPADTSSSDTPKSPVSKEPLKKRNPIQKIQAWFIHLSKKQRILVIAAVVVVLIAGGFSLYYFVLRSKPKVIVTTTHKAAPIIPAKPTTVPATLTGLPVDPSVNSRPVTAIMIENSTDARPQSGLDQAGVVFEALAEGGITRFVALFQDTQPDYIGPVRSARPYYIEWALGFDAAYAHVGGSGDALADIATWHVKDLSQFTYTSAFERISSRAAPHNVYTSIAQLNQVESQQGYTSTYTGFARKKEAPSKTPNASSINMTFSSSDYNTHYDYDATTNSYKRSEGGAAHMELNKDGSTVQITPKVIVAMIVPESNGALDSIGAYYSSYAVVGSGQVLIFQDGVEQTGTWTKSADTSQISFTDANGKPLTLNPGQTWIGALGSASDVTYN